jgi:hypothetical protein
VRKRLRYAYTSEEDAGGEDEDAGGEEEDAGGEEEEEEYLGGLSDDSYRDPLYVTNEDVESESDSESEYDMF